MLEDEVFRLCKNLKKITLHDGITTIKNGAFESCLSITEFVIPKKIAILNTDSFAKCEKLKTVTIPKSVKTIKQGVFKDCKSVPVL